MNTIKITPPSNNLYTLVPNWFIDHFLERSNGDFVKVYLLLLRSLTNHETQFSTSNFADRLQLTESDIVRALKFWSSQTLLELTIENQQVTGITFIDPEISKTFEEAIVTTMQIDAAPEQKLNAPLVNISPSDKPQYTMEEMSSFMSANAYKDLIYVTGRYLGRTLTQNDLCTLISFNDWLCLPFEVIEWLIEYCASNDHRNMRYIEKVALEWADQNINTLEKAKAYTDTYNKKYYAIKKALGLSGRNPVAFEIKTMDKWYSEYHFDTAIILEACDRTMKQAPNGSFQYADKILSHWHDKKVHILADILLLDEEHTQKTTVAKTAAATVQPSKNKFVNYEQRSYDYDKIEKKAMEMLLKENAEGGYRP